MKNIRRKVKLEWHVRSHLEDKVAIEYYVNDDTETPIKMIARIDPKVDEATLINLLNAHVAKNYRNVRFNGLTSSVEFD